MTMGNLIRSVVREAGAKAEPEATVSRCYKSTMKCTVRLDEVSEEFIVALMFRENGA